MLIPRTLRIPVATPLDVLTSTPEIFTSMSSHSSEPPFRLKVTAGPDYAASTHQTVEVNGNTLQFESDRAQINLNVRIQDYNGMNRDRLFWERQAHIEQGIPTTRPAPTNTSNILSTRPTSTPSPSLSFSKRVSTPTTSSSEMTLTTQFATSSPGDLTWR